jgi:hypothetical protein
MQSQRTLFRNLVETGRAYQAQRCSGMLSLGFRLQGLGNQTRRRCLIFKLDDSVGSTTDRDGGERR